MLGAHNSRASPALVTEGKAPKLTNQGLVDSIADNQRGANRSLAEASRLRREKGTPGSPRPGVPLFRVFDIGPAPLIPKVLDIDPFHGRELALWVGAAQVARGAGEVRCRPPLVEVENHGVPGANNHRTKVVGF